VPIDNPRLLTFSHADLAPPGVRYQPKRSLNRAEIDPFLREIDWVEVRILGDNVIVDLHRDEVEPGDDCDGGSDWLAALAPLRADVSLCSSSRISPATDERVLIATGRYIGEGIRRCS
jgi:hypothetical protein